MFGSTVTRIRRRMGMTQERLAAETGLSVRSIRDLENGRVAQPRTTTVRLLTEAFRLPDEEAARFADVAAGAPWIQATPVPPAELPPLPAQFVGRSEESAQLTAAAGEFRQANALPLLAVVGPSGIGKTAFAVHWARLGIDDFPDGQICLELGALDPLAAVRRLLLSMGVAADAVPDETGAATALYRSLTYRKRMLIVLDDAASADQVLGLLPGGHANTVLVTSRDRLTALTALHGAHRLVLAGLPAADAQLLLERLAGADRVAADPRAAEDLARRCLHRPLALRLAGADLADRGQSITTYTQLRLSTSTSVDR